MVKSAGATLVDGLKALQSKYPHVLANARGVGTLVAVDFDTAERRDAVTRELLQNGVDIGGCGSTTMRARPGLYFTSAHAKIFLDKLGEALDKLK